jgi:pimeloyl-ACP methyl ester carboxylesterase
MEKLLHGKVELRFEEAGSGGVPIVLMHGLAGDHSFMRPQFEHFRKRGRTISLDLRAHGQSSRPEITDENAYSVKSFSDDVVFLCKELKVEKAILIGHSLGGAIALETASRHPGLVSAVALLDAPIFSYPAAQAWMKTLVPAFLGPDSDRVLREFAVSNFFIPSDNPSRKEAILEALMAFPREVFADIFESLGAFDAERAASTCRVPTLYLHAVAPCDLASFKTQLPTLQTGQTVGAGHYHQLEVPEQVNMMIEKFLSNLN